jgi:outer membrane protein assembly factor BamB
MKTRTAALAFIISLGASGVFAQDWPQWRGANRDAKAADFKAPKTWPRELTQKWKVTVGEGVATPALAGDKLYVFSREQGSEVTRALNAADGKELWQDKYESLGASGAAQSFSGPRSSPAVANGKVVTVGVRGMISCLDAATGKKLWRKDEFNAYPGFHPSSSPMIVDGLAIAQLGGKDNGALVAYDLATGEQKWKWSGPSPAYASPVLMTVGGSKLIVAQTETKLVAVNAADGKLVWESAAAPQGGGPGAGGGPGGGGGGGRGMGGGRDYKAATPIVDGQTLFTAGRGVKAVKLEKDGDKMVATELWSNPDKSVQFNTPALKNGMLYGIAGNNEVFCINAKDGKTAWAAPFPGSAPAASAPRAAADHVVFAPAFAGLVQADPPPAVPGRPAGQRIQGGSQGAAPGEPGSPRRPGEPGRGGGGRGGGMGGGMGGGGFSSVVDAGSVLLALTPSAQLVVFEPSDQEFKQLASYKVAAGQTHAYPVASGNRIFIKDKDSVTLWTVD